MTMNVNSIISRFTSNNENWKSIIDRVASVSNDRQKMEEYMLSGYFIPAGQILRGAGLKDKVLYNSFVTSIDADETEGEISKRITRWTELGSGVGINVSEWVRNRANKKTNYLKIISEAICKSQQTLWDKGITRTATMVNVDFNIDGISDLSLDISRKEELRHINLGILLSNSILEKAQIKDSPENKKLKNICNTIWKCGNPGLIFIDNVNKFHPFKNENINACNSCAEQFLLPNEGCCLGSINLSKFIYNKGIDFERLQDCIKESIVFLDLIIDASSFPCHDSKLHALNRRRIGLGIMGLGTMLEKLNFDYNSKEAINLCDEISKFFKDHSINTTEELAKQKGAFPDFNKSTLPTLRRNSYLNSIAPTGAISMLFQNSSGIEPVFANKIIKGNIEINLRSSATNIRTAYDIDINSQIEMLATWQNNIDGGISKTLNISEDKEVDHIFKAIIQAWRKGCKGLSIYRNNSRKNAFSIT